VDPKGCQPAIDATSRARNAMPLLGWEVPSPALEASPPSLAMCGLGSGRILPEEALRDVVGNGAVGLRLEAHRAPSMSERAKDVRVAEDLGERHRAADPPHSPLEVDLGDRRAALHEIVRDHPVELVGDLELEP